MEYCWNTDSWNRNDLKTSRNHTDLLGAYLYTPEETVQEFQRQHKQNIRLRDGPFALEPPSGAAILQGAGGGRTMGFYFGYVEAQACWHYPNHPPDGLGNC